MSSSSRGPLAQPSRTSVTRQALRTHSQEPPRRTVACRPSTTLRTSRRGSGLRLAVQIYSTYSSVVILQYAGLDLAAPLDGFAAASGANASSASASATTTSSLILGVISTSSGTATAGTGFTSRINTTGAGGILIEDRFVTATGSALATPLLPQTTSANWVAQKPIIFEVRLAYRALRPQVPWLSIRRFRQAQAGHGHAELKRQRRAMPGHQQNSDSRRSTLKRIARQLIYAIVGLSLMGGAYAASSFPAFRPTRLLRRFGRRGLRSRPGVASHPDSRCSTGDGQFDRVDA